jgi:hypothetical protein
MDFPDAELSYLVALRRAWKPEDFDLMKSLRGAAPCEDPINLDDITKISDLDLAAYLISESFEAPMPDESFAKLLGKLNQPWRLAAAMAYQKAATKGIDKDVVLIPTCNLDEDPSGEFHHMAYRTAVRLELVADNGARATSAHQA